MSYRFPPTSVPHPGELLYNQICDDWESLEPVDQAQHTLANHELYVKYQLAQIHGAHIHNYLGEYPRGWSGDLPWDISDFHK